MQKQRGCIYPRAFAVCMLQKSKGAHAKRWAKGHSTIAKRISEKIEASSRLFTETSQEKMGINLP